MFCFPQQFLTTAPTCFSARVNSASGLGFLIFFLHTNPSKPFPDVHMSLKTPPFEIGSFVSLYAHSECSGLSPKQARLFIQTHTQWHHLLCLSYKVEDGRRIDLVPFPIFPIFRLWLLLFMQWVSGYTLSPLAIRHRRGIWLTELPKLVSLYPLCPDQCVHQMWIHLGIWRPAGFHHNILMGVLKRIMPLNRILCKLLLFLCGANPAQCNTIVNRIPHCASGYMKNFYDMRLEQSTCSF